MAPGIKFPVQEHAPQVLVREQDVMNIKPIKLFHSVTVGYKSIQKYPFAKNQFRSAVKSEKNKKRTLNKEFWLAQNKWANPNNPICPPHPRQDIGQFVLGNSSNKV